MAVCRRRTPGGYPGPAGTRLQDRMRSAMMSSGMTSFARRISLLISVLALGGVAVSSVSLYHHYGPSQTSYCDFGESFNCDIVNRSIYSTVSGIPMAVIGTVGNFGILALADYNCYN